MVNACRVCVAVGRWGLTYGHDAKVNGAKQALMRSGIEDQVSGIDVGVGLQGQVGIVTVLDDGLGDDGPLVRGEGLDLTGYLLVRDDGCLWSCRFGHDPALKLIRRPGQMHAAVQLAVCCSELARAIRV